MGMCLICLAWAALWVRSPYGRVLKRFGIGRTMAAVSLWVCAQYVWHGPPFSYGFNSWKVQHFNFSTFFNFQHSNFSTCSSLRLSTFQLFNLSELKSLFVCYRASWTVGKLKKAEQLKSWDCQTLNSCKNWNFVERQSYYLHCNFSTFQLSPTFNISFF